MITHDSFTDSFTAGAVPEVVSSVVNIQNKNQEVSVHVDMLEL